ncbi:MAG TPA: cellulose binding domain-containing protein [Bacillota bacterium]|nr:cellulose binding domain-containing protein [Bacillota bacterium]
MKNCGVRKIRTISAIILGVVLLLTLCFVNLYAAPVTVGNFVVDYVISSDWGGGATINVTLKNNGAAVNGWTVGWTFPGNQTITSMWSGTYTQSGASVSVKDAGYNASLPTGGSTSFGFNANYSGTNAAPTSFTVNSSTTNPTPTRGATPTPTSRLTPTPSATKTPTRRGATATPTQRTNTPTPTRANTPTPTSGSGTIVADGYAAGTTGGAGGTVVTVTNASDLSKYATASGSYIINVSGNMGDIGDIKVASNKTIQGVGTTARITGEFSVDGTSNVIFKNLTITHPGSAGAGNGIDVLNSARNVFITKCYFYDVADECIGVTKQADYVTVSWCKFDYPSQVDHNFSVLIGSDDALTSDQGKLHVTFHHNWWSTGTDERMPSVRFGTVHCYNNYYNAPNNGYCVRVRLYSQVLVENNYFENVKNPIEYYNTTGTNGKCKATGNVFVNTAGTNTGTDSVFTPPYGYSMDVGSNVKSIVSAGAGNR